jgi:hypothetical protein
MASALSGSRYRGVSMGGDAIESHGRLGNAGMLPLRADLFAVCADGFVKARRLAWNLAGDLSDRSVPSVVAVRV